MKKQIMLTIILVASGFTVMASYYPPCPPYAAPVDGGLSLLLIAGVAGYSAKKVADRKKQKVEGPDSLNK